MRKDGRIFRLAFPNYKCVPTQSFQFGGDLLIAQNIAIEFLLPIFRARLGRTRFRAPGMAMPEAAVHEDHGATPGKHHIRTARKVPTMKSVAEPTGMSRPPHSEFRGRVLAPHSGHQPGAPIRRKAVQLLHSAAVARTCPSRNFDLRAANMARAIMGDTLFPIIRKECQMVG
jgi:hypothetical protein